MKNKVFGIFLLILSIFMCSSNLIYALHSNVLSGYNQVTNVGGSKSGEGGVTVSKTIAETEMENYFDITLTVTSEQKVSEIISAQDLAIVVVMDISNTMVEGMSGDDTRYEAALAAANDLIDSFASYASGTNADRKIGYVAFNTSAHQIFGLTTLKNTKTATTLKNTVKTKTGEIINDEDYWKKGTRFTNIEAGLARAKAMLDGSDIQNKYIIILSDGFPTTYIKSGYTGYNPYMKNKNPLPTSSTSSGDFYNEVHKLPCLHGTDYSNRAAIKARNKAKTIKDSGVTIFSVGVGLSNHKTISYYMNEDKKRKDNTGEKKFATVDVDKGVTDYEIGNSISDFKNWLKNSIGSGYYYDAESTSQLKNAYKQIFEQVKELSASSLTTTWVVEDPMGVTEDIENIQFVGLYDVDDSNKLKDSLTGTTNFASFANNKIIWDLKKSKGTEQILGEKTTYKYEVKYRVRLKNELDSFKVDTIYKTNNTTTLFYVYRLDNGTGAATSKKTLEFPIPSIVGYLGNFTFTKKSSFDNTNLSGAEFKLTHDPNCLCHSERKYATIEDALQTSDINGTVTFSNIPSGHTYILTETKPAPDYELSTSSHNITVSYGTVTGTPENNTIINEISKGNLEIQKLVQGDVKKPGEFEFILEVKYKNNPLTGIYNYKLNDTEEGTIDLSSGIIKLKKDDKIVIYDLPVGATYSLKETTINGFKVEYEVNSNGLTLGETATCDNDCRIESGDTNKVKFINSAGYILPATGSSTMLILIIIGSILLGTPVIYIGYSFYKRIRNVA